MVERERDHEPSIVSSGPSRTESKINKDFIFNPKTSQNLVNFIIHFSGNRLNYRVDFVFRNT